MLEPDEKILTRDVAEFKLNPPSFTGLRLRRYQKKDIPIIVYETKVFCAGHLFYSKLPFSGKKLALVLVNNLENQRFFCDLIYKADGDGKPIAGMAAMITGYAMCEEVFSEDLFHFVKPKFRTGVAFGMLISSYLKWAREQGVYDARLSYTGEKDEGLTRLLKRWGFERFGTLYDKIV